MLSKNNIPQHIAIIMDGNGRWAKERGLPRTVGHKQGIDRIKEIVKAANELGIKIITFFTFSTENWSRPKKEVDILMRSLDNFLKRQIHDLKKNNIRFITIGRSEPVPQYLQTRLKEAMEYTRDCSGTVVNLAFNYGGRTEIVDAAKNIIREVEAGVLNLNDIQEDTFSNFLYTKGLPDPDLLIRTSGEMRISNFLLWQLSYTELYFPKKYWPDFRKDDLIKAIKEFQERERRFGKVA